MFIKVCPRLDLCQEIAGPAISWQPLEPKYKQEIVLNKSVSENKWDLYVNKKEMIAYYQVSNLLVCRFLHKKWYFTMPKTGQIVTCCLTLFLSLELLCQISINRRQQRKQNREKDSCEENEPLKHFGIWCRLLKRTSS